VVEGTLGVSGVIPRPVATAARPNPDILTGLRGGVDSSSPARGVGPDGGRGGFALAGELSGGMGDELQIAGGVYRP
jgi:hypothetical protein